jgi:RNA polymerase sigma-70 factor (ECF subfamily)
VRAAETLDVTALPTGGIGTEAVVTSALDFHEFYREARPAVGRALAVTLGDADLAADAVDEAMARAYQRWAQVARLDNPGGWVYRVGLNWARSVLRRRRRPNRAPVAGTVDPPGVPEPSLLAALQELDVKQRSVVVCRYLLDLSTDETAAVLHLRRGTVKSRLSRALTTLRRRLPHLDPGALS